MPRTRRAILKSAAALSALAALPLPAQTPPAASPTPTPAPEKKPGTLAKLARERYGKFLTEEELTLLDDDMEGLERRSARLHAFKLSNAEEPAVDFAAVRR
ncbi:MAG TPA: hypothetical protein VLG15_00930 [Thermoanaerobaculia bacterium]|nr:hypothetical protein [Thermoanaerobaculia bacterium]